MKSILHKFLYALLCATLLVATLGVTPARAASFVVNTTDDNTTNDAFCTLREAIDSANNAGNGDCGPNSAANDTITFSVSGTIVLGGVALPSISAASGALTIDGAGQAVTISGNDQSRIFNVSGATLTLDHLTLTHGITDPAHYQTCGFVNEDGGAICAISGANVTVKNSTLSNNYAQDSGGAIWVRLATLTVINSTFTGNSVTVFQGGAIGTAGGVVNIYNSTFSGNSAPDGSDYHGSTQTSTTSLNMYNTIMANSLGGVNCRHFSLGPVTGANNLIESAGVGGGGPAIQRRCNFDNGVNGNILYVDPNLGALTGSPAYFPLNTGSPAIDSGSNAICAGVNVNNESQNGPTRPYPVAGVCDIGSYELDLTPPPTVASQTLQATYTGTGPSSFTVTFSENVSNAGGGAGIDDVANPNNYVVMEQGSVSGFQTTACNNINATQDTRIIPSGVIYTPNTAVVNLGSALPAGSYRLFVCGTTSIVGLSTIALAGNGTTSGTDFTFDFTVGAAAAAAASSAAASSAGRDDGRSSGAIWLPSTGFAPNVVTRLPEQPAELAYTQMSDLWLEIPSQGVKANIVGVPQSENIWDVKWLGNDAGWLNGTAFPSWEGNSVLTAHVMGADGLPGPFAKLQDLNYGERIIVHMLDQQYVFEVRNKRLVRPDSTSFAFEHLEDASYLTLVTCSGYNEEKNTYSFRRIIRTVLVEVK